MRDLVALVKICSETDVPTPTFRRSCHWRSLERQAGAAVLFAEKIIKIHGKKTVTKQGCFFETFASFVRWRVVW